MNCAPAIFPTATCKSPKHHQFNRWAREKAASLGEAVKVIMCLDANGAKREHRGRSVMPSHVSSRIVRTASIFFVSGRQSFLDLDQSSADPHKTFCSRAYRPRPRRFAMTKRAALAAVVL